MASLAEIRARLQAAESKQGGQSTERGDNSIYPHWNMEEGQSATLRFLPDGNSKNTFFWQERAMIRLPFNGIKGEMDSKQVMVQVPCIGKSVHTFSKALYVKTHCQMTRPQKTQFADSLSVHKSLQLSRVP